MICRILPTDCNNARATSGKIGFGYRFGTFAVEGWWSDYGKGNTNDPGGSLRLLVRAAGPRVCWASSSAC